MKTRLAAVALIGSLVTAPAFAWGDREQGALAGIATMLLWQRLNQPQVIVQPPPQAPSYGYPAPQNPVYGYPSHPPVTYSVYPQCRQVLTIQLDRFGNEYRVPATICN